MSPPEPATLTQADLAPAVEWLAARDPALARVVELYGPPPLWAREPGFPTLLHIILEQQVSLASARAAFDRLRLAVVPLTPAGFLALDDPRLRAIGFSRQKARYGRELARAILAGTLDLDHLAGLDDDSVALALKQLPGIGDWTATIYLLMALRRPDVFPTGDIALAAAARQVLGLDARPAPEELLAIAERWRPYRAVAARLLWHWYLSQRAAARTSAPRGNEQGVVPG